MKLRSLFYSNIIDVAAMDSHNLQPQELNNRIKMYSQKLAQQWNSINDASNLPSGLLKDVPNPEILLSSTPVAAVDLNMVSGDLTDSIYRCIEN